MAPNMSSKFPSFKTFFTAEEKRRVLFNTSVITLSSDCLSDISDSACSARDGGEKSVGEGEDVVEPERV